MEAARASQHKVCQPFSITEQNGESRKINLYKSLSLSLSLSLYLSPSPPPPLSLSLSLSLSPLPLFLSYSLFHSICSPLPFSSTLYFLYIPLLLYPSSSLSSSLFPFSHSLFLFTIRIDSLTYNLYKNEMDIKMAADIEESRSSSTR